ncbi:MAG: SDR family NAD(P)-dependent oxidoreductase, partial [Bacteroidales bacterium]|nr:SDR family NAD(P)-dependent oxidoreductase [Bacteroidales bacterium]
MQGFKNKVIWITGASSGIGEACAYRFAQEGSTLILTALEEELLSHVQEKCILLGATAVTILPFDLARIEEVESLANKALQQYGRIDILYNNAGISQRSATLETDMSVIRKIMDINYYAAVVLTKTILPQMISNGGGQLVVTSSIAGKFG